MEKASFITNNAKETSALGKTLAQELKGGEILSLIGDLGGGKTTFTQGIAQGLKIKENIISPTFVVYKKFPVNSKKIKWLHHFDLYRIASHEELIDLGFEEAISDKQAITVIEWAQKAKKLIPAKNNIKIIFKYLGKDKRKITFKG